MDDGIRAGQTILFQGDSITDAGRDRAAPASMGTGYAYLVAALHGERHPDAGTTFLNRGVSGNRAGDLAARWQADALDLRPDWVSILVGINDAAGFCRGDASLSTDGYRGHYRRLLEESRAAGARFVILEPFLLALEPEHEAWRADLDTKIRVARGLAAEFGARYVPLDGLFAAAAARTGPAYWAPDGVHPSPAGHALIARAWLRAVRG